MLVISFMFVIGCNEIKEFIYQVFICVKVFSYEQCLVLRLNGIFIYIIFVFEFGDNGVTERFIWKVYGVESFKFTNIIYRVWEFFLQKKG